jgi:outer membrane protein OmpA-like peptidoglycan-associated protein
MVEGVMRYWFGAAAAAAAVLALAAPAHAQTPVVWGGPYGGLDLGADWGRLNGSATIPGAPGIPAGTTGLTHSSGATITGGGQAGYNYQFNNFVFGVEGDFKGGGLSSTNTVTGATPGVPGFIPGDSFRTSSDWNASARGRIGYAYNQFLFYGTGGIAFADVNLNANYASPGPGIAGATASNSTVLMGPTFGGGIEYAVSPNVSVGGEFRHTDYGSDRLAMGAVPTIAGSAPVSERVSLHDNVALLKVNYRFGAPPPPPPPMPMAEPAPPPPAAPKVFIVYFDWDKDTITPTGMQVVQAASDAYKSGAPVQIQVTGYTDRSGSPAYNQRLSERRANNVANALARLGVPRTQMAVSGRGENDNRVPTAAGVREKENRRVEIVSP